MVITNHLEGIHCQKLRKQLAGARFLLLRHAKEILPIVDKPTIRFIVRRSSQSGD